MIFEQNNATEVQLGDGDIAIYSLHNEGRRVWHFLNTSKGFGITFRNNGPWFCIAQMFKFFRRLTNGIS